MSGFYGMGTNYGAEIFVDGIPGGLKDVILLDNTLHGAAGPSSPDDNGISGYGDGPNVTNVLYQGNTIYDIGGRAITDSGNGIVLNGVGGGTVRNNVVYSCGGNNPTCGGPSGIVALDANDVEIEWNEVYGMQPVVSGTGCGWNGFGLVSPATNIVVQYNYAHDNAGTGYLSYITSGWSGNTFRYNIGQNNDPELALGGSGAYVSDLGIYNNTFYEDAAPAMFTIGVQSGGSLGGMIANNIFYSAGNGAFVDQFAWNEAAVTALQFRDNDYYAVASPSVLWGSATYESVSAWAMATGQEMSNGGLVASIANPLLANAGTGGIVGGYDPGALSGYVLSAGSPMIGVGLDLSVMGGVGSQDFFGNAIPNATGTGYNIGADGAK